MYIYKYHMWLPLPGHCTLWLNYIFYQIFILIGDCSSEDVSQWPPLSLSPSGSPLLHWVTRHQSVHCSRLLGCYKPWGPIVGAEGKGLRQSLNYLNGRNIFRKLNVMRRKYNEGFYEVRTLVISQCHCTARLHNNTFTELDFCNFFLLFCSTTRLGWAGLGALVLQFVLSGDESSQRYLPAGWHRQHWQWSWSTDGTNNDWLSLDTIFPSNTKNERESWEDRTVLLPGLHFHTRDCGENWQRKGCVGMDQSKIFYGFSVLSSKHCGGRHK